MEYKRKPLEEYEIQDLKRACQTFEEEFVINILLETGLRVSELSKLRKNNISWQRDCIVLIGKGKRRKIIPMSKRTRNYLIEFHMNKNKINLGKERIRQVVKRVGERIGLKISPHVLRHTFAVSYLHKGGNVRALQGILGHSCIRSTDIYLNYSGTRVMDDFKRVWE